MFTVKIETKNAAFDDNNGGATSELAGILRDVAADLYRGQTDGPCRDYQGNTVGRYHYEPESECACVKYHKLTAIRST